MKMINISRNGEYYIIKTIHSIRIIGKDMFSKNISYKRRHTEGDWFELNSGKLVNEEKKIKLNRWLKNHQKFIELK